MNNLVSGSWLSHGGRILIMAQKLIVKLGAVAAVDLAQCQATLANGNIHTTWTEIAVDQHSRSPSLMTRMESSNP